MLHQTLIPSSQSFFPSLSPSPLSYSLPLRFLQSQSHPHPSSQAEKETPVTKMEALKTSLRTEAVSVQQQQSSVFAEELAFVGERGNNSVLGDGFSVEELLDLGEFAEQLETQEFKQEEIKEEVEEEEEPRENESSNSSDVTFELPPPPSVIDLPAHDAEELEWVSLIMDDSLSELPPSAPLPPPVPALAATEFKKDGMPGPTACALSTEALVPVKSRRSKRSRAAVWSLSGGGADSSSSSSTTTTSSCSSSSFSSFLFYDSPFVSSSEAPAFLLDDAPAPPAKKHKPKKRGRKPKPKTRHPAFAGSSGGGAGGERRCSHCGVQKTPQWRAGPEGAKTLCNACGVRYKSGRLLPEYRPACSPTFISNVHSNSHRKVLEMRRKKEAAMISVAAPPVTSF